MPFLIQNLNLYRKSQIPNQKVIGSPKKKFNPDRAQLNGLFLFIFQLFRLIDENLNVSNEIPSLILCIFLPVNWPFCCGQRSSDFSIIFQILLMQQGHWDIVLVENLSHCLTLQASLPYHNLRSISCRTLESQKCP